MQEVQYSDEQLYEIGKNCYDRLAVHCQNLEVMGFWEQAKTVMQRSSTEVLDLYVQSVLMELAIYCGNVIGSQLAFIQAVPVSNPLGITEDTVINSDLVHDVEKMYKLPPVLIQLCSLHDKQKGDDMTEYFIDALLNILLCMKYLNGGKNSKVDEFIQLYYNKVSYYILEKSPAEHSSYLLRKLTRNTIECDVKKKVPPKFEWLDAQDEEGQTADLQEKTAKKAAKKHRKEEKKEQKQADEQEKKDKQEEKEKSEREDEPEEINKFEETDEPEETDTFEEDTEEKTAEEAEEEIEEQMKTAMPEMKQSEALQEKTQAEKDAILSAEAKEQFLVVKRRLMAREKAEQEAHEQKIQELMGELNGLVGLDNVKQEIHSLINLIKIRKLRTQMHLPEMEMSYHMVFTGSPGTGKTTVARLVAKIYKELGILSEGNLVETDRSGLVAGYVGQTAIKVHEIVDQAIGGILFIDEAYSLANPDVQNDFGVEAVDTLVKLMEDNRDNLVVIVAGYTDEMQNFLKSNTGLISRFNKFIDFPDYTKEELVEIMNVMAEHAGLTIEEAAQKKVLELLEQKEPEEWESFGNARGIRNMFEKFIMNQADRLVMVENPSKEDLILIKKEDIVV